jgi:hypothetical protein
MAQEDHEKHAAGQLEDAVSEDAARFLGDKELGLASLNASHEAHIAIIDRWEQQVVSRERKQAQAMLASARADSVSRDRRRILEIVEVTGRNNSEVEEHLMALLDDERSR